MVKLLWMTSLALALSACGGHSATPKNVDIATRKDEMCACKNKTCAAQVNEGYSSWRAEQVKAGEQKKPEIVVAYEGCWSLAMKDELVSNMTKLRDQACACNDAGCGQAAAKAQADWGYGLAATMGGDAETDPSVDAALDPLTATFDACVDVAEGADATTARWAYFRDAMCACTDKACAQQTDARRDAWSTEIAKRDAQSAEQLAKQSDQDSAVMLAYLTCKSNLVP